jgi:hypothetical protein
MVQVGFPGWVSSDRGIDCNIFGGYTCGPDLVCTACSTAGNSCLCADPDDLYTCTCCYGLACIDGVCTG